jgi:hypothetical protein
LAIYPAGHPNQGTPILGSLTVANSISIGTATPWANLDVAGGVKIGDDQATCDANKAGTMRYDSGAIEYCDGTQWKSAFTPSFVIHDAPGFDSGCENDGDWCRLENIGLNRMCIPFPKDGWSGVEEVICAYDPSTGWIRGLTDDDAVCSYACFDE